MISGAARRGARGPLLSFVLVSLGCGSLGSVDPAVPYRVPDGDWALGVTVATAWDESASPVDGGGLLGVDVGWLEHVFGLHAGMRIQHEGKGERLSGLVEATAWYVLLFGVGARAGWMVSDGGPGVPDAAFDVTLLVALPLPLWKDCRERSGALVIAPYARPGFRLTGGDPDPDDVRGFHELGLMLRWSSFAF